MRLKGQITSLSSSARGFGFLMDEEGQERFFHVTMLELGLVFADLAVGDLVTFEPLMTARGARAMGIQLVEGERKPVDE